MERYKGDFENFEPGKPETYCITDNFTGEIIASGLTDNESTCDRVDRMNKEFKDVKSVVDTVTTLVNRSVGTPKDFAKAMGCEHRTLQQGFTKICVAWLEHLASLKANQYDLRNEDSVKLAKQVVQGPDWETHKCLRYI
jgi:hypothetical protein